MAALILVTMVAPGNSVKALCAISIFLTSIQSYYDIIRPVSFILHPCTSFIIQNSVKRKLNVDCNNGTLKKTFSGLCLKCYNDGQEQIVKCDENLGYRTCFIRYNESKFTFMKIDQTRPGLGIGLVDKILLLAPVPIGP